MMSMRMRGRPVPEAGARPGEALERAKRRRILTVKGAVFAVGLFSGAYMGYVVAARDWDFSGAWSPVACVALAAAFLAAMIGGSIGLSKHMDELERQNGYRAASAAGAAYLVVYPLWFLLWKGGFVGEPIHWVLFLLFWVVLATATIYYRFR